MWSKIFSPLLADRLSPSQKFPQLLLSAPPAGALRPERRSSVLFSALDERSAEFARRDIPPGAVVELRDGATRRLCALGFYEPARHRVDVFYRAPRNVLGLPVVDEDFFARRVEAAWDRRRRVLPSGTTNAYRAANGAADGLPPLYVDVYSSSFARLVAASAGAARVLPRVAELLRQRGAEELIASAPVPPPLRSGARVTLVRPTVALTAAYAEGGVRGLWLPPGAPPEARGPFGRWLLCPAHRRARHAVRAAARGRRVLCVGDRGGAMALGATMAGAARVIVAETDGALLERTREALVANHGAAVFDTCETTDVPLEELSVSPQDIVCLEHSPRALSTAAQWGAAVRALLRRGVCREGTVIVAMQEAAPLGVAELAEEVGESCEGAAGPRGLFDAVCQAAGEYGLRLQSLQMLGPSLDFPVLPTDEALCFSHILRLEKDIL